MRRPDLRATSIWRNYVHSNASYRACQCAALVGRNSRETNLPQLVGPPPTDFDFRDRTLSRTRQIIRTRYNELSDLVEEGSLIAVERSSDYKERRTDGYLEPELVLLVGCVHVSQNSAEAARRVVEAVRPDNVVLELCRDRTGMLYASDTHTAHAEGQNIEKQVRLSSLRHAVQSTLNGSSNAVSLLLLILADQISSRMQKQAGFKAGAEMRAAKKAAEAIGSQIVLGDRPIQITVERVWKSLDWQSKLRLLKLIAGGLTTNLPQISPEDVAKIDSDDAVDAMTKQLTHAFPQVASALLHERDLYLSWSLKRSKAVNGCKTVVGIIGKGHMPGVVYHLMQDSSNLRFRDLAGTKRRKGSDSKLVPQWLSVIIVNVALIYLLQVLLERLTVHA